MTASSSGSAVCIIAHTAHKFLFQANLESDQTPLWEASLQKMLHYLAKEKLQLPQLCSLVRTMETAENFNETELCVNRFFKFRQDFQKGGTDAERQLFLVLEYYS